MPTYKRRPCVKCGQPNQRHVEICHACERIEYRLAHPLKSCWHCGNVVPENRERISPYCSTQCAQAVIHMSCVAGRKVMTAIRRGQLPKLDGSVLCVDCGKPAHDYDHRDYNKPLDVQPVCRGCNIRRGPADVLAAA